LALTLTALKSTVAYFYTPSDLRELSSPPAGLIRLGGLVAPGSVKFGDDESAAVNFIIRDETAETPVSYEGILPDLFREGQGVVVQGRLQHGRLIASEVLAKHDENYMPKEVADALKEQGRWKEGQSP
ncbi:MAG: cytochrome c maturation protein CcmE, partial [Parvularculaceae bacterium]|nr:cytochrome c maturation protein CcmE [Parvularculaceae bacterium]